MAQLVQYLPGTQKIAGSSPARGSSSFSLEKKELSSGVVACICLVSITDYSCIYLRLHSQAAWRPCGATMGCWGLSNAWTQGVFLCLGYAAAIF